MFATYEEAMEWIHTRKGMGPKPGIVRMKWLMEKLDHPERKFRSIHIAGTNGKGSNVAYLRSLFMAAGYTVGTFTSPHIVSFNERIGVNGANIPDEDVLEQANILHALYEEIGLTDMGPLTEFEVCDRHDVLLFWLHIRAMSYCWKSVWAVFTTARMLPSRICRSSQR